MEKFENMKKEDMMKEEKLTLEEQKINGLLKEILHKWNIDEKKKYFNFSKERIKYLQYHRDYLIINKERITNPTMSSKVYQVAEKSANPRVT